MPFFGSDWHKDEEKYNDHAIGGFACAKCWDRNCDCTYEEVEAYLKGLHEQAEIARLKRELKAEKKKNES